MSSSVVSPRLGATGLLLVAGVLFVVARLLPDGFVWVGLFRAATEAALVGGLADWFAVVALFRHPLGLPIPHTAVIPNNKDRIGESLGGFVERNFLDPELIGERLSRAHPSRHIGAWLAKQSNASWLADRATDAVAVALRGFQDRELKAFVVSAFERNASPQLAPLIGRAVRLLVESDRHQDLLDEILAQAGAYIESNQPTVLEVVESKSAWWVPKQVDRQVASTLSNGLVGLLRDLKQRDHEIRLRFTESFERFLEGLERDPEVNERIVAWVSQWMEQPEFARFLDTLMHSVRARIDRDLAQEHSIMRAAVAKTIQSFGRSIVKDLYMQARFDEKIIGATKGLLVPWRHEIGLFVSDVVKGWDAQTLTDRLESSVGNDLQYIRINGTLVGALVGCILYGLSHLVF